MIGSQPIEAGLDFAYGAPEIKRWIALHTRRAFIVVFLLSILLAIAAFVGPIIMNWIEPPLNIVKVRPTKSMLDQLQLQQEQDVEQPPPPPVRIEAPATVSVAGTPVAVPDDQVKDTDKEFADTKDLASSLSSKEEANVANLNDVDLSSLGTSDAPETQVEPSDEFEVGTLPTTVDADLMTAATKLYTNSRAYRMGLEGSVIVGFVVEKDARVSSVRVIESSGYPELDQIAKKVISEAIYTAGKTGQKGAGQTVAVKMQRPITFRLR